MEDNAEKVVIWILTFATGFLMFILYTLGDIKMYHSEFKTKKEIHPHKIDISYPDNDTTFYYKIPKQ